jgi:hypothetical protein
MHHNNLGIETQCSWADPSGPGITTDFVNPIVAPARKRVPLGELGVGAF